MSHYSSSIHRKGITMPKKPRYAKQHNVNFRLLLNSAEASALNEMRTPVVEALILAFKQDWTPANTEQERREGCTVRIPAVIDDWLGCLAKKHNTSKQELVRQILFVPRET